VLNEHRHLLKGNVVFIFQYGEEIMPGGSQEMINDGDVYRRSYRRLVNIHH
jgi:metal-dependent amidase/aminoacylase/carboxypeptidase family protein